MNEKQFGNRTVKFYDSIDELPIKLYNLMNEYSIQDFEIGNSMEDVVRHFARMDKHLSHKNYDAVIQIRKNMHQTYFAMLNGVNYKSLQLACMIHSVDGKEVEDRSREGLTKLMNELSMSVGDMKKELTVKKKISRFSFKRPSQKSSGQPQT